MKNYFWDRGYKTKGLFSQVREEKMAEEKTKRKVSMKKMDTEARKQKTLQVVSTAFNFIYLQNKIGLVRLQRMFKRAHICNI